MKTLTLGLLLMSITTAALAVDKVELDNKIRALTAKFEEFQKNTDRRIPAEHLNKAQGIILLNRTKAGFIFAYQGGSGVALVKDPKSEKWSPAVFLKANEASLGFQIGGEQSFVVILLMNTNATHRLTKPAIEFGGEARGTAGDTSAGEEGKASNKGDFVLVYSDRKGLYGGVAIKGGDISPDNEANFACYGQALTPKEILFDRKSKPTDATTELVKQLIAHSKARKP